MAVWSAFTDYTKFFAIILLVSTLLRPNAACNPEDLDWWRWRNPCEKVRTVRHGRDTELYGQLNNAIRHIEKDIPQLKRILVPKGTRTHQIKTFNWLKFPKFNKRTFKRINNETNLQALVEFHKALRTYGATIYTLINRTEIIDITRNNVFEPACSLLSVVSYEVRRLTCEVDREMEDRVSPVMIPFKKMKIALRKKMSASKAQTTYIGVLNTLKTFLKKSRIVLFGNLWKKRITMKSTNEKQ